MRVIIDLLPSLFTPVLKMATRYLICKATVNDKIWIHKCKVSSKSTALRHVPLIRPISSNERQIMPNYKYLPYLKLTSVREPI